LNGRFATGRGWWSRNHPIWNLGHTHTHTRNAASLDRCNATSPGTRNSHSGVSPAFYAKKIHDNLICSSSSPVRGNILIRNSFPSRTSIGVGFHFASGSGFGPAAPASRSGGGSRYSDAQNLFKGQEVIWGSSAAKGGAHGHPRGQRPARDTAFSRGCRCVIGSETPHLRIHPCHRHYACVAAVFHRRCRSRYR